jgi:oligogalacturonide lyase
MCTWSRIGVLAALMLTSARVYAQNDIPTDWIDPDTGHRVIRLSREDGSQSSYFHQNEFTPDGKRLVFTAPTGLYTVDLQTRAIEQIRAGRTGLLCVGRKTGLAYYISRGDQGMALWAVNPDTKEDKKVIDVPRGLSIANINCDETLAGGTFDLKRPQGFTGFGGPAGDRGEGVSPLQSQRQDVSAANAQGRDALATAERGGSRARPRGEQRPGFGSSNTDRDMQLVTLDLKTGEVSKFNESHAWLNHVQFSPTDPHQMLFCHEGTWELMDRTWIIRTDGTGLTNVHPRTMNREINGHEFFSPDGKSILYDLQTPRSRVFWLACYDIGTKKRTWYNVKQSEWSVHFNISPDQKLFCGDGGGPSSVAAPDNGQWVYLFRPHLVPPVTGGASDPATLIQSGHFEAEKLVNLSKHNYSLEPNGQFTPDGKWIVFRSNMFGPSHVFEVEVAKAKP